MVTRLEPAEVMEAARRSLTWSRLNLSSWTQASSASTNTLTSVCVGRLALIRFLLLKYKQDHKSYRSVFQLTGLESPKIFMWYLYDTKLGWFEIVSYYQQNLALLYENQWFDGFGFVVCILHVPGLRRPKVEGGDQQQQWEKGEAGHDLWHEERLALCHLIRDLTSSDNLHLTRLPWWVCSINSVLV